MFVSFTGLKSIHTLSLASTRITNEIFEDGTMNLFCNLFKLNVSRNRVSDAGLCHLHLGFLEMINADQTYTSPAAFATIEGQWTFCDLYRVSKEKINRFGLAQHRKCTFYLWTFTYKKEAKGRFPFIAFCRARDNFRPICGLGMRTFSYLVAWPGRAIAQKSRGSSYFSDRSPEVLGSSRSNREIHAKKFRQHKKQPPNIRFKVIRAAVASAFCW